jgi:hypothetical protein
MAAPPRDRTRSTADGIGLFSACARCLNGGVSIVRGRSLDLPDGRVVRTLE